MPAVRSKFTVLVASLLLLSAATSAGFAQTTLPAREEVQYGPHARHKLILWHARGTGPRPVLVYFFGGAFAFGSPSAGPFKGDMLKAGVTVVGGSYRFRQDGASKREIMEDGARVIQFLRLNAARFNLNPHRIGVCGFSSGGVVASWIALHNDLRNPLSPDPVLRQSSRVQVCCLYGSQVHPLDLDSWARYTGSDRMLLKLGILNYVLLKLDGRIFRDPIDPANYATPADYERAQLVYRNDVFGFYQCTADDPPVCFYEDSSDDPARYVKRNNNGGGLHSPLLMIPMQRRLKELQVPVLWGKKEACRNFLLSRLTP